MVNATLRRAVSLRKAVSADAAGMANVHISSWRETYTGLMPQPMIDELPLRYDSRYKLWQKVVEVPEQVSFVAEHEDYGIVGFVNGGKARDDELADACEVYCLYLLQACHGQGVGYELLRKFFAECRQLGYSSSYAWVLEGNPTIRFYERTGAKLRGDGKTEECFGAVLKERCFVWEDIASV